MNNQNANKKLSQIGKVMIRKNENGIRSEQSLKIQVTRRMLPQLRSSIHLAEDKYLGQRNIISMRIGSQ